MTAKRNAVLEGIAYGADSSPGDRLRAIEMLGRLEPAPPPDTDFRAHVAALDDQALARELDAFAGAEIVADALRGDDSHHPVMAAAVRQAVEERARELADTKRIEQEIERRAEERARQLYASRAFTTVVSAPQEPADPLGEGCSRPVVQEVAQGPPGASETPSSAEAPPGLTREDVERPWQPRQSSLSRARRRR